MILARKTFRKCMNMLHRRLDKYHDAKLSIETSEVVNISDLDESLNFSGYEIDELYSATPMALFNQLHSIVTPQEKRESTYIDVGCGKARTLVFGVNSGFKKLIGVEFVPSIAELGRENVRNALGDNLTDVSCEIVSEDIREFAFPDTDLILYLFNPFDLNVFEVFVANLLEDLRKNPREATIIYYHSHCEKVLNDSVELERIKYSLISRIKLRFLSAHRYGAWLYKPKAN